MTVVAVILIVAVVVVGASMVYLVRAINAGKRVVRKSTGKPLDGPNLLTLGLGNQYQLLTNLPKFSVEHLIQKYGRYSTVYLLTKPFAVVAEPDDVYSMMTERWEQFDRATEDFGSIPSIAPIVEESLFVLPVDSWRASRRVLDKGFMQSYLRKMLPHIQNPILRLAKIWKEQIEGNKGTYETNVSGTLQRMTTDVIGRVGFGMEFNCLKELEEELQGKTSRDSWMPHIDRIMKESTNALAYIPGYTMLPTPGNVSMKNAVTSIQDTVQQIIDARRQYRNNHTQEELDSLETGDLVDIMMEHSEVFNDKSIFTNGIGFLLAGGETTSVTLSWALWLLANHPEVMKKAQEEARRIIQMSREAGCEEGFVDMQIMEKEATYLNQIEKEVLRLYPAAWMNIRVSPKNETVELGDLVLPPSTSILIPIMAIHRDEKYWGPTASQFIPERWDPANQTADNEQLAKNPSTLFPVPKRGSYLPFNLGRRDCIGKKLATLEMKLTLVHFLNQFSFSPVSSFTPCFQMAETLKPGNGMQLNISLSC